MRPCGALGPGWRGFPGVPLRSTPGYFRTFPTGRPLSILCSRGGQNHFDQQKAGMRLPSPSMAKRKGRWGHHLHW